MQFLRNTVFSRYQYARNVGNRCIFTLLFQPKSKNYQVRDNSTFFWSSQKTWTLYMFPVISSLFSINLIIFTWKVFTNFNQTQWKIYKPASSNFYGSWLSFPGHEQSRKFVLGTPKILSPALLLKGFLPRCRTCRCRHCSYNTGRSSSVHTLVDFYQKKTKICKNKPWFFEKYSWSVFWIF